MEDIKPCPVCGEKPVHCKPDSGLYKGFERAYHWCKLMGYILIQDWTTKVDFARWNTRFEPETK